MAELFIVRHGQASFNDANYDQLSPLGITQAQLLGSYFAERDIHFDLAISGTQQRHKQTLDGIVSKLPQPITSHEHAGLNEYDFDAIMQAYLRAYPDTAGAVERKSHNQKTFYHYLKIALKQWAKDELPGELPETWQAFMSRINQAIGVIQDSNAKRVLVVSSGGVIGAIAQMNLQAPVTTAVDLNMQIKNTSFSQYFFKPDSLQLSSFNNLPHLEQSIHHDKITYT